MTYTINKTTIYGLVDAEMSRVADEAYDEQGASLYDRIVLTDKDKPMVEKYIDDAVTELTRRMSDVCTHGSGTVTFTLPDMPSANESAAQSEITRYITLFAVTALCQERRPALAEHFSALAKASLEGAVEKMRNRTAPSRT